MLVAGDAAFDGTLPVRAGSLTGVVQLHVLTSLAALRIVPAKPNPDPNATLVLRAIGADASGDDVAVDGVVRWSARNATIDVGGALHAGAHDAVVVARAGGVSATLAVPVGRHDVPIAGFGDSSGAVQLAYDLTGTARASYARMQLALPGEPVGFVVAVDGDDSGVPLRAAFTNGYGESVPLTLAAHVDWRGSRELRVPFPPGSSPPLTLRSLYVVASLGGPSRPGRRHADVSRRARRRARHAVMPQRPANVVTAPDRAA